MFFKHDSDRWFETSVRHYRTAGGEVRHRPKEVWYDAVDRTIDGDVYRKDASNLAPAPEGWSPKQDLGR